MRQRQAEIDKLKMEFELAQAEAELMDADDEDDYTNQGLNLDRKSQALITPTNQPPEARLMPENYVKTMKN